VGEVRSLNAVRADRANDNSLLSPSECLGDTARELEAGELVATKALVLLLDTGEGDDYGVAFRSSNLRVSEMIALIEVAKARLLEMMGL